MRSFLLLLSCASALAVLGCSRPPTKVYTQTEKTEKVIKSEIVQKGDKPPNQQNPLTGKKALRK